MHIHFLQTFHTFTEKEDYLARDGEGRRDKTILRHGKVRVSAVRARKL